MTDRTTGSVLVLGAGMIGVTAALELQARGLDVTLVDRRVPGMETSYGNAGVLTPSSIVPLNNPDLWARLPRLMSNRTASLRFSLPYVLRNLNWARRFLTHAKSAEYDVTVKALDSLIGLSASANRSLLEQAGVADRLVSKGWLFTYRTDAGFAGAEHQRKMFDQYGITTEVLKNGEICDLEPNLKSIYSHALWIKDASSVDNPSAVVQALAKLFKARGGTVKQSLIQAISRAGTGWAVALEDEEAVHAKQIVVALGPWSNDLLKPLGAQLPMAFERGYHRHFDGEENRQSNSRLGRPICDTQAGFVLAPMEQGLRLTTGVELAKRDAPKNLTQLRMAEASAREAIDLGVPVEQEPWVGSRPTLPDSRPAIGEAPNHKGLFLAFGHQHIGFGTGTGTAKVLADLMGRKKPPIDPTPFAPGRF